MITLKAEVEKGFMRTAVGHGLVVPKSQGNPDRIFGERESGYYSRTGTQISRPFSSEGRRVYRNVTEPEDVGGNPGKSSPSDHGICLPGDYGLAVGKALHFM